MHVVMHIVTMEDQVRNLNSRELDRVSVGISAVWIRIPRKKYGRRCMKLVTVYRRGDE